MAIPTSLRTERLLLRCWQPSDAPRLVQAITRNLDYLRPWMPWAAHEPVSFAEKAKLLRKFRADFRARRDFIFGMFDPGDGMTVIGSIGLHRRIGAGAAEIGYWVDQSLAGRGLCTEAAREIIRFASQIMRFRLLEIHCDPANLASAAIPRKLGFTMQCVIRNCVSSPTMVPRDTMVWTLPTGPASAETTRHSG